MDMVSEGDDLSSKEPKAKATVSKPDGIPDDLWSDFMTLRKAKKAPLTPTAMKALIREADKAGWWLEDAIREVVERGWQSFKATYVENMEPPRKRKAEQTIDQGPARTFTESEAQALMPKKEFEEWKARQSKSSNTA